MKTYKTTSVDNLQLIARQVQECISLAPGSNFFIQDTDYFKKHCPALCDYLKSINLFDRWSRTGIVKLEANSVLSLHSDGRCRWALNLPVQNCSESYTIWYDAELITDEIKPVVVDGVITEATYVKYREDTAVEIDRVCADQPLWVNVQTPHSAINKSDNPRILITLRFYPELDDILINSTCATKKSNPYKNNLYLR